MAGFRRYKVHYRIRHVVRLTRVVSKPERGVFDVGHLDKKRKHCRNRGTCVSLNSSSPKRESRVYGNTRGP